jgi:subtilisin family serine protease
MRWVALVLLAAIFVVPGSAQAARTGRLLVTMQPPAPGVAVTASATAVTASAGALPAGHAVPQVRLVTVRPRPGQSLRTLARHLRADPRVRRVEVEHRASTRLIPNDPAFTVPDPVATTGEPLEWWAIRSHFPEAWDRTTGAGVAVAIIDQGVDGTHPDLAGKIRAVNDLDATPGHGGPLVDESGHGTHVASLACGQPNNAQGIAGAGYGCGLIVEKSDLTDSSVIAAIVDATKRGAGVISMSIGTDDRQHPPQAMVDAVDYAYAHDVVLVAAASDHPVQEQGDPANILQPRGSGSDLAAGKGLTVTAADFLGGRASFAGLGSEISLAAYGAFGRNGAPGRDGILAAFPPLAQQPQIEVGRLTRPCMCVSSLLAGPGRYAFLEGTSMATPIVAGAAALVRDANPDLDAADVIRVLKQSAQREPGTAWSPEIGWGVVDARAAVDLAMTLDRRAPTSSIIAPAVTAGRTVRLRLQSTDTAAPGVPVAGVKEVRVYQIAGHGRAREVATVATPAAVVRLPVRAGHRYTFYTRAVDKAGNVERRPRQPDAQTRIARDDAT